MFIWQDHQHLSVKKLIDRVEFDAVGGNIAITFHETGLQRLAVNESEVPA